MAHQTTFSLLALSTAALLVSAQPNFGQHTMTCNMRDDVVAMLTDKYGETRRSIALGQNNAVVEVYASAATGTWTITVTTPAGMTCLLASGQSYETLAVATDVPGKDL